MKKLSIGFVLLMLLLAACSSEEGQSIQADGNEQKQTEQDGESTQEEAKFYEIQGLDRELTEIEKELLRHPGIFSGDKYDEVKVKEALDQIPDDLTQEEYMEELIYLFAEDYYEEMEALLHFDSSVDVSIERPDEDIDAPTLKTAHYAILIDASGSMAAQVGNKTRMDVAKEAVLEFARQVPEEATISLRVYGHEGSSKEVDKELSCRSTETIFNAQFENAAFQIALDQVNPVGWTPIALALESVNEDIPESADEVIVYVVSDGIETCHGDPVQEAKKLVSADIQTVVNIIGFDVDHEGQKLLKEVADAGNGEFTYVQSERELRQYLRAQYEEIQRRWLEWKEAGKAQANELKEEKKALANDTKESMKEKSNREKERMKEAQTYLKERFDDYNHPASRMFSMIVDYGNAKWRYAVDTGNHMWRESVDNGNREWSNYVDEGNNKINETIQKKNAN
ncbi:VWA domain-containing protein [Bacillus sp. B15-48]|uniref:VWA domain-containing protein n=1 Tax=Bacillus sp. B15-48 TaxID=1548601 RepID=UPI00193F2E9C|nr:VWA domain-containing protein [Bacillus sp. B15-48]MBM4761137.1 VWA domain-containing protein [Bacillus sp. B15-48]